MRIIGGQLRGRKLHRPTGRDIRPTADRLREAVFNILGERVLDARVLDLFAGTGALAIEALSRGARDAVLVDRSRAAVRLAQRNLGACGLADRSRVIRWDIGRNLNCLSSWPRTFDLVFMDPPYGADILTPALAALTGCSALAPEALLVVELEAGGRLLPPEGLREHDRRRYGGSEVVFLATGERRMPLEG